MTASTRTARLTTVAAGLAAALALGTLTSASAPRFYRDDPVWVETPTENAAGMKADEVDLVVDLAYNLLTGEKPAGPRRAGNVNSVDEVPDSSWFTNRLGRRPLTAEDVARGPNRSEGPAPGPWTVTSSKSDGVTPGFTVKDAAGQRWFLKFDPPGHRGMATGTEVAVTKLMWALGYHVPENHVAYLRREQLQVAPTATYTPRGGRRRAMRTPDLDALLERADREADGSYRVVASRALEGQPIGRIRFYGTRPDDPNDIVPHEDRRELRGYGVFAAWLNHVDAKAINSLDTLVREGDRAYVRHHLIDFGSSLGSGGVGPADPWAGEEYLVEPSTTGRQMLRFGFGAPSWQTAEFYESSSIGRLRRDQADFDPAAWRPRVPNRAFLHARADDRFWAAQRLAALSADMIAAAVRAGDFGDPDAEAFLVHTLVQRRDAILRDYLPAINPVADPALDAGGLLTFRNAAVDADVARAPRGYQAVWAAFDNTTRDTRVLGTSVGSTTRITAPPGVATLRGSTPEAFVEVRISAIGTPHESWLRPVTAWFRADAYGWRLVGFERLPDAR